MDSRITMLLEKAKVVAERTGRAAENAGRRAGDMAQATRINLQIFDLNNECEVLYKEIGKMMYEIHLGAEVLNQEMDERIEKLDDTMERIAQLRTQLAGLKPARVCQSCGRQCGREDVFCAGCGAAL